MVGLRIGGNPEFLEGRWCGWRYAVVEHRRVLWYRGDFDIILKQNRDMECFAVAGLEFAQ